MMCKITQFGIAAVVAVIVLARPALGQPAPPVPTDIDESYQTLEKAAPMSLRQDLQSLREQGREKGWKFQVGVTAAFTIPLSQLASTEIPENFLALAIAQEEFSSKANGAADESARLAGVVTPEFLGRCQPGMTGFNWRDENMVTKIQSQRSCGSCWAFTTAASYEGAFKIRNGKDVDVSEQGLLDCAIGNDGQRAGTCKGGWYYPAFEWMIAKGAAARSSVPYQGKEQSCIPGANGAYRAVSWGFVTSKSTVPLIRDIKKAVCQYGPIAAAMEATTAFQAYVRGYFNEGSNGRINHAVTIVGWNDDAGGPGLGAWLVKNSWSTGWGEQGYVWVAYNTNKIGYASAWVRPVENNVPVASAAIASAWEQTRPGVKRAIALTNPDAVNVSGGLPQVAPFLASTNLPSVPTTGAKPGPRTVWIQYGNADQKQTAESIRTTLTASGYFAPAVEDVSKKGGKLPERFQIRYFSDLGKPAAEGVAQILAKSGLKDVALVKVAGFPKANAIEVWFPRG